MRNHSRICLGAVGGVVMAMVTEGTGAGAWLSRIQATLATVAIVLRFVFIGLANFPPPPRA